MKFIKDESAVIVDKCLVLGELHIGIESELYSKGFSTESSTNGMRDRIIKIAKQKSIEKIIILGDVKHNYLKISKQEEKEIPKFFEEISKVAEVHVCLGNHDGLLREILPDNIIVHETEGFLYKDNYFIHGNAWPSEDLSKAKRLFMAHIHPAVEFKDSLGYRHVEFCWVRGPADNEKLEEKYGECSLEEIIIVPPFNRKIGGMPVNNFKEKEISPITRNEIINIRESDVYLLDGTHLGVVEDIRK